MDDTGGRADWPAYMGSGAPNPDSLVEEFVRLTGNMASPEIWRRWCAISMVSTAMSRRIWTCIEDDLKLFPNLYVMLVGKPGLGKSRPIEVVRELLCSLRGPDGKPNVVFSPDEVTRQRVIQHLGEVFTETYEEGDRSYLALISEFATFLPEPDASWMQAVARLWDCPPSYVKETKEHGADNVHKPYVSLLAGVQPSWFETGFPRASYEMGLPARIYFIFADQKPEREFFRGRKQVADYGKLAKKLQAVNSAVGDIPWTDDAQTAWIEWAKADYPPKPDDPLLAGFTTRRDMHAGKLALIAAISTHPTRRRIELPDLQTAWAWLTEAEQRMPEALSAAGGNVYRTREELVLQYVRAEYARTGKFVHEREVRRRLAQMVSTQMITPIINEMVAQQRLKVLSTSEPPHRLLKPGAE